MYLLAVSGVATEHLFQLLRRCPELDTLVLAELAVDDLNIRHIIEACPKLCRLGYCTTGGNGNNSACIAALREVLQHFYPRLEELALSF